MSADTNTGAQVDAESDALDYLNPRQARFVEEYIIDLNATQAAIRAGYSPDSAHVNGSRLLKNARVAEAVTVARRAQSKRLQITADRVLAEIADIAFADLSAAFDDNGNLRPIKDIPESVRRAISSVEVFEEFEGSGEDREQTGFTKKLRTWDKTKSLELLGKHLKLFVERHEHTGKDGAPLQIIEVPSIAKSLSEWEKENAEVQKVLLSGGGGGSVDGGGPGDSASR